MLATLVCAQGAGAAGLPTVSSGERPGPPLLYAPPPTAPELSVQTPFAAQPLLVSGTDALRGGEYLYQDYLFDDHGANTAPGPGSQPPGSGNFSATAGDVSYPTAARFANNAADVVEIRVARTADAVVYRVTLGTVLDDDTAVVGIGIDTDAANEPQVEWPLGADITSPGLDRFVTAWGTGGKVSELPGGSTTDLPAGSVSIDQFTNQMTIRVPDSSMPPPGNATWRLVAGAGLYTGESDGDAWKNVKEGSPEAETPGSGSLRTNVPGVINLAFRFDEPQGSAPNPEYDTAPGYGNFFEDKQAKALAGGTSGGFHADVNFADMAAGATKDLHAPGVQQARIFASGQSLPEGVRREFPEFGGRLQPYLIRVPPNLDRSKPAGLTFSLHSLGGTYTQYAVFSPTQLTQFGDERQNLVVTTLGRGEDGWYTGEAEADFFEVWRDVAANFSLDPDRVYPSGYSMGGYGTYKLGVQYPDLFARAFTTVGPPGLGVWPVVAPPQPGGQVSLTTPLLGNVRWIPYMNWVGAEDQLVPYPGPTAQQNRFDQLGLRSELWTFQGDHFTLALLDRWNAARDFLGAARKQGDPSRVVYGFFPEGDKPDLGLLHDHAYWVSGLRARVAKGNPATDPARADVDARSLAFGEADPTTGNVVRAEPGPPSPAAVRGTAWTGTPKRAAENTLELDLKNVSAATVDGPRARLDGDRVLRVRVASDGSGTARLDLDLPEGAVVERESGPAPTAASSAARARAAQVPAPEVDLDRQGATFALSSGTRSYVIRPVAASEPDVRAGGPGDDDSPDDERPADDSDDTAGSGSGSLPFTGLAVLLVALTGLALAGGGRLLRSRAG